ncbi:MAG: hypothetical protein B7Z33_04175 [Sphingomonadales bacterium 12-68-11]|nr:MAG: hypothetical protein B7Z33_04175 [Sphingomonadales bacterium 12-68-11]
MPEPRFLLFASDATLAVLAGAGLLVIALWAALAERRRVRRARIDAVGWMPWNALFLTALFGGVSLVSLGVRGWLAG